MPLQMKGLKGLCPPNLPNGSVLPSAHHHCPGSPSCDYSPLHARRQASGSARKRACS